MAIYKTTKVSLKGDTLVVTPTTINLSTSYITTEEDNEQKVNHLTSPFFDRALDTRMDYLPRTTRYKHNKYKKRSFKIKPYNSMLFKDIPFTIPSI